MYQNLEINSALKRFSEGWFVLLANYLGNIGSDQRYLTKGQTPVDEDDEKQDEVVGGWGIAVEENGCQNDDYKNFYQ